MQSPLQQTDEQATLPGNDATLGYTLVIMISATIAHDHDLVAHHDMDRQAETNAWIREQMTCTCHSQVHALVTTA